MTNPIRLSDAARFHDDLPHQIAAWEWLQDRLDADVLESFADIYRAEPEQKQALPPKWIELATKIVKRFEGCRLKAYKCPAGLWTIGFGTTRFLDNPVKEGDVISKQWADDLLIDDIRHFGAGVARALPTAKQWPAHQVAALVSFAYNVGLTAFRDSTLRRRLEEGKDPRDVVVKEEMMRWVHAGEVVLAGLERRREAEIELFCNDPTKLKAAPVRQSPNPLRVTYYTQRDSEIPCQANRMCFSSSCAMLVSKLRPELLGGRFGDDVYLRRLNSFGGDTTSAHAHIQTLLSYKIKAEFVQTADWDTVARQIDKGIPVPLGFYHHGPIAKPSGGGHWLCAIGYDDKGLFVHDPFGDLDLVTGEYLSTNGESLHYSRQNFGPRWMVEGLKTGWAVLATL